MITKLFSEIDAAIIVNSFNSVPLSMNLITAHSSDHLDKTLEKVWRAMSFLNDYADGFFKLCLVINTAYKKRASHYKTRNGLKIEDGWMSLITGIIADKPSKIRGDRVDLLVYEEAGCHIAGTEVLMYDGSFKKVEDILLGDILMGDDGTPRNVIELHTGVDQMYKISPEHGDTLIVNSNHILYGEYYNPLTKTYQDFTIKTKDFYKLTNKENYYLINVKNSRIRVKFSIDKNSIDKFYGFSLDGNLLFVLKDFTVCHNSWPGLIKAFILSNALVGQPGSQWGYRIGGGKYPDTCR